MEQLMHDSPIVYWGIGYLLFVVYIWFTYCDNEKIPLRKLPKQQMFAIIFWPLMLAAAVILLLTFGTLWVVDKLRGTE